MLNYLHKTILPSIQILDMIEQLKNTYKRAIEQSDWLSMSTINAAKEKVIRIKILM